GFVAILRAEMSVTKSTRPMWPRVSGAIANRTEPRVVPDRRPFVQELFKSIPPRGLQRGSSQNFKHFAPRGPLRPIVDHPIPAECVEAILKCGGVHQLLRGVAFPEFRHLGDV